jgi:hypothetical protein
MWQPVSGHRRDDAGSRINAAHPVVHILSDVKIACRIDGHRGGIIQLRFDGGSSVSSKTLRGSGYRRNYSGLFIDASHTVIDGIEHEEITLTVQ